MSKKQFQVEGVEFTDAQAYALAELCKRISWSTCRDNAVDDQEASHMVGATDRLRAALERAGFSVR